MVRRVENRQIEIGATPIASLEINPDSRDDIPRILRGLQYIYKTDVVRKQVFHLLETHVLPGTKKDVGRPGMEYWKIFVLGVLRLDLNCDYDRVQELANQHKTIRQMLGHSDCFDDELYELQTIKDNVRLLTPELLEKVNKIVVQAGHELLTKKQKSEGLRGRCDSFVFETNVHYPTDINLLNDSVRKIIRLTSDLCARHGINGWRQSEYNVRQFKKQMRATQQKKRISGKTEEKKAKSEKEMKQSHRDLITMAQEFIVKAAASLDKASALQTLNNRDLAQIEDIKGFIQHAERQINQIDRRVLQDETIPHDEKVFSIFQPHTEWVSKGKAGVPVEFGVKVCIMEDQHQFILHHRVMVKETDDKVAIPMVKETKSAFPNLASCSFDKGFHSPDNHRVLDEILDTVALKRKGRLSKKSLEKESSVEFKAAAKKHSAVESGINALEVHGLDKCYDHGIDGLCRYTALAVVTRNIHRVGDLLHNKEQAKQARKNKRCLNGTFELAA